MLNSMRLMWRWVKNVKLYGIDVEVGEECLNSMRQMWRWVKNVKLYATDVEVGEEC